MKAAIALAIVLFAGIGVFAQERNARVQGANEVRLKATVLAVVPLSDFSGDAVPVDFDPSFALTVRIKSAIPMVANLRAGAVVNFAIHSPAELFPGDTPKGKTYEFSLCRKVEEGTPKFSGLCQLKYRQLVGSCE